MRAKIQAFWPYMAGLWPMALWLPLLAVISALCSGLQPWPLKLLLDRITASGAAGQSPAVGAPLSGLVEPLGIALASLAIFIVQSGVTAMISWIRLSVCRGASVRLSVALFSHLQRCTLRVHRQRQLGDLMTVVAGDSRCLGDMFEKLLITPLLALLTISGVVVVMFRQDPFLAALSCFLPPAIIAGSLVAGRPIHAVAEMKRNIEGRLQSLVQQTLSTMPLVQAYTQERNMQRKFQKLAQDQIRSARRSAVLTSFSNLGSGFLSILARGVVIWFGVKHILAGRITVGDGALFISYFEMMLSRTNALSEAYPAYQNLRVSADRCLEILNAPVIAEIPAAESSPIAGALSFVGVTTGYEPGKPVLSDLSFSIQAGELVGIVSPSGGGKSTLLSLIPRLDDPWDGRIEIDGKNVRSFSLKSLRGQIAMVFQDPGLFSGTVTENIAGVSDEESQNRVTKAASLALAEGFITRLPNGYHTLLNSRGAELSGGMKQRVAIARALFKEAPILILDEPTSALDPETEQKFLAGLVAARKGKTTLLVTHRLYSLSNVDRILVLSGGSIVEDGAPSKLLARGGLYARLHSASQALPGLAA